MANRKLVCSIKLFFILFLLFVLAKRCDAKQGWQLVDREIENKVLQVNVGLKIKLQNNWVRTTDISSKKKYYVFTTCPEDLGFQVVGHGSTFSLCTDSKKRTFFVTSKHVLDNAEQIRQECEMFYVAVMFYAKNFMRSEKAFQQLIDIVNLADKHERNQAETKLYKNTVNAVWDCYDNNLSKRVDPKRQLFNKYRRLVSIITQTSYFLHAVGPSTQKTIEAKVYKTSASGSPDLAILVAPARLISDPVISVGLPLDFKVKENENIQIVGYPEHDGRIKEYHPTFSAGKITKVKSDKFEFAALVTKGDSGGPVISQSGKALGVVTCRLLTREGRISPNQGAAIKTKELKCFAPELFKIIQR